MLSEKRLDPEFYRVSTAWQIPYCFVPTNTIDFHVDSKVKFRLLDYAFKIPENLV